MGPKNRISFMDGPLKKAFMFQLINVKEMLVKLFTYPDQIKNDKILVVFDPKLCPR